MSEIIALRATKEEKEKMRRYAEMQGKTISAYCKERCLLPWTHRDLENLGFGLVLEKLREKHYEDAYIKRFVGEMLLFLDSAPEYSPRFEYDKAAERERKGLYEGR